MSAEVNGRFRVSVEGPLRVAESVRLQLHYTPPAGGLRTGGNLWFFFDIRQLDEWVLDFTRPDSIVVRGPVGTTWEAEALVDGGVVRTFDIHAPAPEFLHVVHVKCVAGAVGATESVTVELRTAPDGFLLPRNAIDAFRFWLVEDPVRRAYVLPPGTRQAPLLPAARGGTFSYWRAVRSRSGRPNRRPCK